MPNNLYLLIPLTACVASSMLLVVFLAGRQEHRANRAAAVLTAGIIAWSFCEILWNTASDAASVLRWVRISSVGWVTIGPLGLLVLTSSAAADGPRLRRALPWLYGLSAVFLLVALATPWMHTGVVRQSWGWSYVLGPAYPGFYAFTVACLLCGLRAALRALRQGRSLAERHQTGLLIVGFAVPMVVASLTDGLLPFFGVHPPRLGTASFAFLGATIAWSFHRYGHALLAPRTFAGEILETLGDGVALLHPDGRIRSANGALARLLETHAEALEGCDVRRLVEGLPLDPPGELRERETQLAGPAGPVPVAVSCSPVHNKREQALGLVLVVRDLREVVSLRRRLLTSGRVAAVGELAAGIAHEINNPVAYIRTNLGVLLRDLEASEEDAPDTKPPAWSEARELIEESLQGVDRIASIVRDLRGLAGGDPVPHESVDLNHLLQTLLRILAPHLRYGARVEVRYDEIPLVPGSPQELKQAFTNLLLNARKSVRGNGTIRILTRCDDDWVTVHVEDDGCGIPADHLERIFDPFFTTDPEAESSGLGLSVAWQVIRQHGGDISVESEPEAGTRVAVRLPRARRAAPGPSGHGEALPMSPGP